MKRACLETACLERACLERACLKIVCLERACLERACLERACLERAFLEKACLEKACLEQELVLKEVYEYKKIQDFTLITIKNVVSKCTQNKLLQTNYFLVTSFSLHFTFLHLHFTLHF